MRAALTLGVLLLVATLASQASAGEPERIAPADGAPRGVVLAWTSPEDVAFEYTIPRSYSRERGATLLLMLHGSNLDRRWAFANFKAGSFRKDDVIVAPDGTTSNGQGGFNFLGEKADAEKAIALVRGLQKALRIERVLVYGHSQGAFFSFYLLGEAPSLVDGIVAHAGGLWTQVKLGPELKSKAIAILHARADQVVPLGNSEGARDHLVKKGFANVKLEVLEDASAQSGHWPRPDATERLLGWCDGLTATTPWSLARTAAAEVTSAEPSLGRALDLVKRARAAAKGLKKDERAALEADVAAVVEAAESIAGAHAAAVKALLPAPPLGAYDAWTYPLVAARRMCLGTEAWKGVEKALEKDLKRHDKEARVGQANLERALAAGPAGVPAAFQQAWKITQEGFLAGDPAREAAERLRAWADPAQGGPPAGVPKAVVEAYRVEAARRAPLDEAGAQRVAEVHGPAVEAVREKWPRLFGGEATEGGGSSHD